MAETLISSKKNALSSPYKLYYKTTTMCPECQTFIPGDVVQKHDSIYIDRTCPTHGFFEGIICSDVEWYEKLHKFDVEPVKPLYSHSNSTDGCPQDCGLCKAHRQIAGTAAIEITNYCNAKCPTCLSDNKNSFNLAVNEVKTMVDNLFKSQNYVDVIVLSGGEPTIHPELFSILDYIKNVNVGRVVINSNGLRISKDNEFLDRLAKYDNIYICLHFDGNNSKKLRGIEKEIQEKALERLCEWGINVTPLILASKGINDDELGILVTELLKRSRFVKSVMISMMSYNGFNGTQFPGDKLTRLTIPSTLDCVERSSEGVLKKSDFIPLPMPNPLCSAIGYFLIEDDEITPLIPLVDIDRAINYITNSNFARIDKELEVFFKDKFIIFM
ncbi:MAG: radical SAM protein [Spirochaetota bacterium]|nr:radical SAM protein [Spirochaetota bacterium]